jgi:2,4-dienoyl-CoA reductase-like NADH-dependent reductase (Old Yellow Enzyme family)
MTAAFLETLFSEELAGHRLIANKSVWRQFPTIAGAPWSAGNVVPLGDAAHTAHFSVGSGTRMAMEDAVALRDCVVASPVEETFAAFEAARRPQIESLQPATQASLQRFEETERDVRLHPLQFAFSLLLRSLRMTHKDLRKRDPEFLEQVDRFVATEADEPLEPGAWPIVSASPIPYFTDRSKTPRELSRRDMDDVRADYVRAAELARAAGFDLLEIHMAHGYLLASFISPLTNTQPDEYRGGLANRMDFPLEVFEACCQVWPPERPMSARISAVDRVTGGLEPADAVEVARLLHVHGCDVIDVTAGQTVAEQRPVYGRLFQTPFADRIRHDLTMATMAVGDISSFMDVNTIIAAGRADLCLLARAHRFDPYWTRHAAHMPGYALPWTNPYKSVERYTPRFESHFGGDV